MNTQNYPWIDRIKYFVSFLVLVIHFRPLSDYNSVIDFSSAQIVARIAVPFFFISSGYFLGTNGLSKSTLIKSLKKNLKLYLIWTLIYLPISFIFYMPVYNNILLNLTVIGFYYHLWFIPALIFSIIVIYLLSHYLKPLSITLIAFVFFFIGVFGDAYHGVLPTGFILDSMNQYLDIFTTTRNGLFFGFFFVSLGYLIQKTQTQKKISVRLSWIGFILSYALMFVEMGLLMTYSTPFEYNMYFSIIPTTFFLFNLCLKFPSDINTSDLRSKASLIYFSHFLVYYFMYGLLTILKLDFFLSSSIIRYSIAVFVSILFSNFLLKQKKKNKTWAKNLI
jgi:serine/alanine racemase